jgi:hypothetical protein
MPPRGVAHHFAPLTLLVRDPSIAGLAPIVHRIEDIRRSAGPEVAAITSGNVLDVEDTLPPSSFPLAHIQLPRSAVGSSYLVFLSGLAVRVGPGGGRLDFTFELLDSLFNNIGTEERRLELVTSPVRFDFTALFTGGASPVPSPAPASVQVTVDKDSEQKARVSAMRLTVVELARSVHVERGDLPRS